MRRLCWAVCLVAALAMFALPLAGCSDEVSAGSPSPGVSETPDGDLSPTPATPEPTPDDRPLNPLTNLPMDPSLAGKRPMAVMINNAKVALPMIGISAADVIYECMAEGGYTRFMALFQDYGSIGTLGSVRSSREYFVDLSAGHDAIYCHAGGSDGAYIRIRSTKIDNLDGVNMYLPDAFWRDPDRKKNMGTEHSLMTNGEKLLAAVAFKKYRTDLSDDYKPMFSFAAEKYVPDGTAATTVEVPYSNYITGKFTYDQASGKYLRFSFDKPHVDGATGEQLAFDNVFVLYAAHRSIPGDTKGRIDVDVIGSGSGWYISGGKAVEIHWSKTSQTAPISLTDENGKTLEINTGKSFVCIAPTTAKGKTVIE